jgi:hypothetical protein
MNKTTVAEKACLALTSSSMAAKAKGEFFLVPSQEAVAASDDVTSKSPTGSFTARILISVKVRTLRAASPSAMNELL